MARRGELWILGLCAAVLACGLEPAAAPDAGAGAAAAVSKFALEAGGLRQALDVRARGERGIDVEIRVAGSCERKESGAAAPVASEGDTEVEIDSEGDGHPVDVFTLEPRQGCSIEIRLAAPEHDFAWLREEGCGTTCPLSSEPMARD